MNIEEFIMTQILPKFYKSILENWKVRKGLPFKIYVTLDKLFNFSVLQFTNR